MTTGGLCPSQTRRTSGGSLALPAEVIFPSFISFQALAMLYFDQLDPFRLGEYRINHLSSSKRLYHPSIQPKHRASSRAWPDGSLTYFSGRWCIPNRAVISVAWF